MQDLLQTNKWLSFSQGVLRIHFLEAQDLEGKDHFLGGLIKGKSDPYGVLHVGNQLFHSKTIKESLHPKWNEVYEVKRLGCLSKNRCLFSFFFFSEQY